MDSALLKRATENSDAPTPGYLYNEIASTCQLDALGLLGAMFGVFPALACPLGGRVRREAAQPCVWGGWHREGREVTAFGTAPPARASAPAPQAPPVGTA
jgi:hypothetical protein